MKKPLLLICAFMLAIPFVTNAGPIIRGGENIAVDASQTLQGDFYGFASSIVISGRAQEDVYLGGGNVTVNGQIAKDLSVLGGTVQVHSAVGDDLRVVGGDVTLAAPVKGDVVVIGGKLTILSTASVEGDVLFWGGELVIAGPVKGNIHGRSEELRVDAAVSGNIEYTAARSFVLGNNADVKGPITYTGYTEVVRAQGAQAGEIRHIEKTPEDASSVIRSLFSTFLILLFSTLACWFIARSATERIVERSGSRSAFYGIIGVILLLVTPIISIVLMVSVVGVTLGILLLAGYIGALVLSGIYGTMMWGYWAQRLALKDRRFTFYTPVIGAALLTLLMHIPFIGSFLVFATLVIALGILSHTVYFVVRS